MVCSYGSADWINEFILPYQQLPVEGSSPFLSSRKKTGDLGVRIMGFNQIIRKYSTRAKLDMMSLLDYKCKRTSYYKLLCLMITGLFYFA